MAAEKKEKLSEEIKVRIDNSGVAIIEHSDAYLAQQERFFAGDSFSKKEMAANQKLIEAEEAQIEAARRDPVGFIQQQEKRMLGESAHQNPVSIPAAAIKAENQQNSHQEQTAVTHSNATNSKLTDAERLERAKQAFAEASPDDQAIAQKNLGNVQKLITDRMAALQNTPGVTPEMLIDFQRQAQTKAFIDEGEKLHEKTIAAANAKKDLPLTYEVANFSQAAGKNMVNADVGFGVETGSSNYGASISHGFNAKALGLDLAEVNGGASIDNNGAAGGHFGLRAVKQIYDNGDHRMFVAGATDATVTGIDSDPTLGGNATGLLVNTHQLGGRPTSEIVGGVVDLETGNTTVVGSVSTMFNADTKHPTTARAVGTYGVETGAGGFSLEMYQQTGFKDLTARLAVGVDNVGETNDVGVNLGASMNF